MKKPILLVKVGTNLLTKPNLKLDYNSIKAIIKQIIILHKKYAILLVSSGAVGAGREIVSPIITDPITKKQVLASVGQSRLLQIYTHLLQKSKIIIAQALLTKRDFQNKESYYSTKEVLTHLLEQNIIPIINENDVTSSTENTFGDNDQLAALTAALMEVEKIILLSDTLGLYQEDPKKNSQAKLIQKVEKIDERILSFAKHSISKGGTGGMYSKVKAAQITTTHGIPTILCSGREKNSLLKGVTQEGYGTYFVPHQRQRLSMKGKWIQTAAKISGKIFIDNGAVKAIQEKNSLLAVGIEKIKGDFREKDIVSILNKARLRIAVGMVKESSQNLKKILNSAEKKGLTIVHRDYLFLHAKN